MIFNLFFKSKTKRTQKKETNDRKSQKKKKKGKSIHIYIHNCVLNGRENEKNGTEQGEKTDEQT